MSDEYRARIMENRKYYADKNGIINLGVAFEAAFG